MAQVTWRADAELVERAKAVAAEQGRSLNDYLTRVVGAATDPDLSGDEVERVRERLARANLLASTVDEPESAPSSAEVEAARRRAGTGTPTSELLQRDRS